MKSDKCVRECDHRQSVVFSSALRRAVGISVKATTNSTGKCIVSTQRNTRENNVAHGAQVAPIHTDNGVLCSA